MSMSRRRNTRTKVTADESIFGNARVHDQHSLRRTAENQRRTELASDIRDGE